MNFNNSVIYLFTCNDSTIDDKYIGSSINFKSRQAQHKHACNNITDILHNKSLYQCMRDNGGFKNWSMDILENVKCSSLYELHIRECFYINNLKPNLNQTMPIRTENDFIKENTPIYKKKSRSNVINAFINNPIITENKFHDIDKIQVSNRTTKQKTDYDKYKLLLNLNISNIESIDENLPTDKKYEFYERITNIEYLRKYNKLTSLLNGDINKIIVDVKTTSKNYIINSLYGIIPIDKKITNKEFDCLINTVEVIELINKSIIPYYKEFVNNDEKIDLLYDCKSPLSKQQISLVYRVINGFLKFVNYRICYVIRTNTVRPYDKLIMSQIKNSEFTLPKKQQEKNDSRFIANIEVKTDIHPLNVIKAKTQSRGHSLYKVYVKMNLQKTGRLKISLKPVIDCKVYKNRYGRWNSYESTYSKSLDKMIKQIETNNTKNVSYKEIYTDCLLDMMFYIYNPRIVHKLVVAEDKKTCNIVEQNDDGFEIVKCGVKEKQEYYESLKFERNVYVARNYKKYNANKNRL